jgi:hypothetical protein
MTDYESISRLLKPDVDGGEVAAETPLQELKLENISYDWIKKCTKPSFLKKAMRLIDEDGSLS